MKYNLCACCTGCANDTRHKIPEKEFYFYFRICYNKYVLRSSRTKKAKQFFGRVAQLGERLVRNEEVVGSIPITSTI